MMKNKKAQTNEVITWIIYIALLVAASAGIWMLVKRFA